MGQDQEAADHELIVQVYLALWDHSLNPDADGLRALFAPGYELVHMGGMSQSAEAFIAGVLDGTLTYFSAEHRSIDVHIAIDGHHATMRGRSLVDAAVFGGGRGTWRLQQDMDLVRTDEGWKLTRSRASTY